MPKRRGGADEPLVYTSKVTSKLQVTVPKALAERYGIHPGSVVEWQAEQGFLRFLPPGRRRAPQLEIGERLRLLRESRARQREREAAAGDIASPGDSQEAGGNGEELDAPGRPR